MTAVWQLVRILAHRFARSAHRRWVCVCEADRRPGTALRRAMAPGNVAVILFHETRPRRVRALLVGQRHANHRWFRVLALVGRNDDPGAMTWLLRRVARYFPWVGVRLPRHLRCLARRAGFREVVGGGRPLCNMVRP